MALVAPPTDSVKRVARTSPWGTAVPSARGPATELLVCTQLQCTRLQCTRLQCTQLQCTRLQCTRLQCTRLQCTQLYGGTPAARSAGCIGVGTRAPLPGRREDGEPRPASRGRVVTLAQVIDQMECRGEHRNNVGEREAPRPCAKPEELVHQEDGLLRSADGMAGDPL